MINATILRQSALGFAISSLMLVCLSSEKAQAESKLSASLTSTVQAHTKLPDIDTIHCIALAIYHEARSEPLEGQIAVGLTVLNRTYHPNWPDSACEVIAQAYQFPWYREGMAQAFRPQERSAFIRARALAEALATGRIRSTLEDRATCFYHERMDSPEWRHWFPIIAKIGAHIFLDCRHKN